MQQLKDKCAIIDAKFSPNGKLLFYAGGYDWSRGAENNDPSKYANNIYLHPVDPVETTKKTLKK